MHIYTCCDWCFSPFVTLDGKKLYCCVVDDEITWYTVGYWVWLMVALSSGFYVSSHYGLMGTPVMLLGWFHRDTGYNLHEWDPSLRKTAVPRKRALIVTTARNQHAKDFLGTTFTSYKICELLREKGFKVVWLRDDIPWFYTLLGPDLSSSSERNVEYWMNALVSNSKSKDSLFFYFSGHGVRTENKEDGYEYDIELGKGEHISNERMNKLMVRGIPQNAKDVHLFGMFDCCHSRPMLDLDITYEPKKNVRNYASEEEEKQSGENQSGDGGDSGSKEEQVSCFTKTLQKTQCLTRIFNCCRGTSKRARIKISSTSSETYEKPKGLTVTCLSASNAGKSATTNEDEGDRLTAGLVGSDLGQTPMVKILKNLRKMYKRKQQAFLSTNWDTRYLDDLTFDALVANDWKRKSYPKVKRGKQKRKRRSRSENCRRG